MRIGYQGIQGSYSEMTVQDYLQDHQILQEQAELRGFPAFNLITSSLLSEELDLAILPVENSTTGLITRTLDLFRYQPICGVQVLYQPVRHSLWGLPGSEISQIRQVYSHPEALSQCQQFFQDHPWIEPISYTDTAGAALMVSESKNPQIAALSSPRAGLLYQLEALESEIQSELTNTTKFFATEKLHLEQKSYGDCLNEWRDQSPERTRLLLYVETLHQPGALAKLLNAFQLFDCNLQSLDARPIKDKPFNYGFFVEVEIGNLSMDMNVFWSTLSYATAYLQVIACYEPLEILMDYLD
ncbi:prephenate dehydratase [Hutsoniella sourekii]